MPSRSRPGHLPPGAGGAVRSRGGDGGGGPGGRLRNALFTIAVAAALALGLHSLLLASVAARREPTPAAAGLLRTAGAAEAGKIASALGGQTAQDLAYVILDDAETGPDPGAESVARRAARALAGSGATAAVRLLGPGDPDFATVVAQNGIGRFPAVLAVGRGGGIVLVTGAVDEDNLLRASREVTRRASSCDEAAADIY